jgi:uncharacterized protein YbaR (Trm112 family)
MAHSKVGLAGNLDAAGNRHATVTSLSLVTSPATAIAVQPAPGASLLQNVGLPEPLYPESGTMTPAPGAARDNPSLDCAKGGAPTPGTWMMNAVPERPENTVDPKLLEILVCPLTKGPLEFDSGKQELISRSAKLAYPIRDGIPIMLPEEARKIE